jgi:hypothetical protein
MSTAAMANTPTELRKNHVRCTSVNCLLQHGHGPSKPLANAENAEGGGSVMIALNAKGAR